MLCSVDDLHKKNDSFAQLFTYVLKTLSYLDLISEESGMPNKFEDVLTEF